MLSHELIQSYFDTLYAPYEQDIKRSKAFGANETYGDILYYSALKLLTYLDLKEDDVFLDVGFGLGKLLFQTFLISKVSTVIGIEINELRVGVARKIAQELEASLPKLFINRDIRLLAGDFLAVDLNDVTVVYLCCTVFSFELLAAMGQKINTMPKVKKIVSFRKLPHLSQFILVKKIFLHGSWDRTPCYVYLRKSDE